jgi:aminoglycoside phosphotransferase (APT) family kinase protein
MEISVSRVCRGLPSFAALPVTDVDPQLVDVQALAEWMDSRGLPAGPIRDVTLLQGGTQNVLLSFSRGGERFVLRRPPLHPLTNGNDTMCREMRVLAALADTDVPHPRLIAACASTDVLGASFYLMEEIRGFNVLVSMPQPAASDPQMRRSMGLSVADAIARLGRVDYKAVGLDDFGKPEGFLARQVPRWNRMLESYAKYEDWDGHRDIPGVGPIGDWLEDNCPKQFTPGILHGDYTLANVLFRDDMPVVAAILDWEMSTIGDPLLDLGWLLTSWPRPDDPTSRKVEPWEGFPTPEELLAHYRSNSTRDMSAMDWYIVLACYKLGIVLEGTFARSCAGKAPKELGQRFHQRTVALFERARALI